MFYKLVLALRHWAYDKGLKKKYTAKVPTVCVGNGTSAGLAYNWTPPPKSSP